MVFSFGTNNDYSHDLIFFAPDNKSFWLTSYPLAFKRKLIVSILANEATASWVVNNHKWNEMIIMIARKIEVRMVFFFFLLGIVCQAMIVIVVVGVIGAAVVAVGDVFGIVAVVVTVLDSIYYCFWCRCRCCRWWCRYYCLSKCSLSFSFYLTSLS